MLRSIGAVILGYVVMGAFVFATFAVAYLAIGADGAFRPGSYEASSLWLGLSILLGAIAALLGGLVSAKVARGMRAPQWLAGLVLVLGLLFALPALTGSQTPAGPRAGDVGNLQAMKQARQPAWMMLLNPLIGAAGVMAGASIAGGAGKSATA